MLGAKIGEGVRLSGKAEIAEYDLVTIGDGAAIEISTVRAFGIDNGAMILGAVSVGDNASVGARSVVAPFTSIPDNAHLGPVSASYEISAVADAGNDAKHVQFNRRAMPQAHPFAHTFVIGPIMFLVNSFSHVPSILVLWWMLTRPWNYDQPFQSTGHMLQWLCDPRRLPYFIGIRVARSLLSPFFYMFFALLIKWCVIGRFRAGPRDTNSQWQLIRHELAQQLFTREAVQNVTELVGRHYELVSVLYRMLGAKVGKRVFWPGRQPIFTGEYDLLEIGDDCVFGSRTALFCTTMTSCEKIILCAGSNVSDNSVVLPGSIIGKGAVLGSNTICPAGRYLPEGSVWLGCRGGQPILLEKGTEEYEGPLFSVDIKPERIQMKGDETTLRPFGKAFYNREATYFVYPLPFIILYTIISRVLVAALKTFPLIAALHGAAGFYYGWEFPREYLKFDIPVLELYPVLLAFFMVAHFFHSVIWLATEVIAKWIFIGQRKEGRYNYDTSTYAQNWELYQITTKVRDLGRLNFLDFISGTPFLVSYFGLLGGKIGHDCCLYPAGGDPYMPEPDLVEIGDRCVIDCAAVVCHLNTRGNFELAKIVLEHNVTLRTRARIQQAVVMETGSMLLEKSLAMTGEIIEADSVWFGGPAARLLNYDCSSISSRPSGGASVTGSHQDPSAYV
jgi:acetyltransferase-like isoleucine patch superfamily enzyme